eukprot:Rhum_TRINITY_DN13408_c0_g1::Rhum_TRINITY_DN13408_c0_g1_i1::g.59911::m.59911
MLRAWTALRTAAASASAYPGDEVRVVRRGDPLSCAGLRFAAVDVAAGAGPLVRATNFATQIPLVREVARLEGDRGVLQKQWWVRRQAADLFAPASSDPSTASLHLPPSEGFLIFPVQLRCDGDDDGGDAESDADAATPAPLPRTRLLLTTYGHAADEGLASDSGGRRGRPLDEMSAATRKEMESLFGEEAAETRAEEAAEEELRSGARWCERHHEVTLGADEAAVVPRGLVAAQVFLPRNAAPVVLVVLGLEARQGGWLPLSGGDGVAEDAYASASPVAPPLPPQHFAAYPVEHKRLGAFPFSDSHRIHLPPPRPHAGRPSAAAAAVAALERVLMPRRVAWRSGGNEADTAPTRRQRAWALRCAVRHAAYVCRVRAAAPRGRGPRADQRALRALEDVAAQLGGPPGWAAAAAAAAGSDTAAATDVATEEEAVAVLRRLAPLLAALAAEPEVD